jgi:hypothetical protein
MPFLVGSKARGAARANIALRSAVAVNSEYTSTSVVAVLVTLPITHITEENTSTLLIIM